MSEISQDVIFSETNVSLEMMDMHFVMFDVFSQYLRLG